MKNSWLIALFVVACLILGRNALPWIWYAAMPAAVEGDDEVTFICSETKQISKGPWRITPAFNPATQRKTLMVAFYCPQCAAWKPGPPHVEDRPPIVPRCQVHNVAMQWENSAKGKSP